MKSNQTQAETGQRVAATVRCVVFLTVVAMSEVSRIGRGASPAMHLALALGALYVLASTFMPERLLPGQRGRVVLVVMDVLLITAFIWFTGRMQSQYYLLYYLPILQASLRLNFREAVTSSVLAAACYTLVGVSAGFDEPIITSAPAAAGSC